MKKMKNISKIGVVSVVLLLNAVGLVGSSILEDTLRQTNPDRDLPLKPEVGGFDPFEAMSLLGQNLTAHAQTFLATAATNMLRTNLGGPNHAVR